MRNSKKIICILFFFSLQASAKTKIAKNATLLNDGPQTPMKMELGAVYLESEDTLAETARASVQFYRSKNISLSAGMAKTGFHTGHSRSKEFKIDYLGPNIDCYIFPGSLFPLEYSLHYGEGVKKQESKKKMMKMKLKKQDLKCWKID